MRRALIAVAALAVAAACNGNDRNRDESAMADRSVTGGAYDSVLANDSSAAANPTNDTGRLGNANGNTAGEVPEATTLGMVEAKDRMEVQTAELALRNASSPAVKNLAQMLRQGHQGNLKKAQDLADQQKVNAIPPSNAAATMTSVQDSLSALSGAAFDSAYVQHEINDHQQAIDQLKAAKVTDSTVQQFVDTTVAALQKHLDAAKKAQEKLGS